ncbi:MAG: AEC family transporter [Candidatus Adiutrix sp.]|jgi:predicted permease|nr:AEC family transporter [Candidatus Adiutrix sp.]
MWPVIQKAVECVLSLFLIGFLGYVLARRRWFTPETSALLPRLVIMVTLPLYMFVNIVDSLSRDDLISLLHGVVVPALSIGLSFGLAALMALLIRVRPGRRGLFCTGSATSNTIFIGLPVNVALFGEAALPCVLAYYFANTTFFWTVGNYCLSLDGQRAREPIFSRATLRQIFSPPLIGFLLGVLLVLLGGEPAGLRPPQFFMDAASRVGQLTTPLAIIFIGLTLAGIKLKNLKPDRDVIMLLLGRLVVSPLTIILLLLLWRRLGLALPPLMAKVFIIQSSLPVVSSAVLMAGYHRSDAAYASVVVSLSTLLAMITIPAYMVVISLLFG